jgi:parallel beta-helix repeat protein
LKYASAIATEGQPLLNVTNSKFTNMLSDYGVIVIREVTRAISSNQTQYIIHSNKFEKNIAYGTQGASGIYLINSINAVIKNNTFKNNQAVNGDGGAIKYI